MTYNFDSFEEMKKQSRQFVYLADGRTVEIEGKGTVKIKTTTNDGKMIIKLIDILYVPKLEGNLFSLSSAVSKGNEAKFENSSTSIFSPDGMKLLEAHLKGGLYVIDTDKELANAVEEKSKENMKNLIKWHNRFGHLNLIQLKILDKKELVHGIETLDDAIEKLNCEVCIKAKQTRETVPDQSTPKNYDVLGLIHSDVCGPLTESLGGAKYFVTFTDDCSRHVTVYFIKKKSETLEVFKKYKTMAENQTGKKIKILRSDNGTEYLNGEFNKFLEESGIVRQITIAGTPEQNGVSERMNRTLCEMANCLMLQGSLIPGLWA